METNNDDQQLKLPARKAAPAKKAASAAIPSRTAANDEIKENLGYGCESFQPRDAPMMSGWHPMAMPPMASMGFQNRMPNQAHRMLNQAQPFAAHPFAAATVARLQRPASAPLPNPVTQFELGSDSSDSDASLKPTKKKPTKKKSTVKKARKSTQKVEQCLYSVGKRREHWRRTCRASIR